MKSFAYTLFLAFVFVFSLSVNAIADDGNIGHGKNCPQNTTCFVDNQEPTTKDEKPTIIKTVIDYLAQLFG